VPAEITLADVVRNTALRDLPSLEAWGVKCIGAPPALFVDRGKAEAYAAQHRGRLVRLVEEAAL
jgi:hypothetical protein